MARPRHPPARRRSSVQRLLTPRVSARFRNCRSWVAFSDLHLSAATQAVAIEVLERVHEEALRRDAGVIFLGDFWHHRGMLPVAPLNAAVQVFSRWRQPTIMLTGNHDQVSVGGTVHSLNAIAAAAPRGLVKVVGEPSMLLDALWLPYRRRTEELDAALALAAAAQQTSPTAAIFCHADIQGAAFNSTFQAEIGLEPEAFPPRVPVYSGHYHKPQVLGGTSTAARIEYVGSPFELSFAEEAQAKRMLIFSTPGDREDAAVVGAGGGAGERRPQWERMGEVALELGPRYTHNQPPCKIPTVFFSGSPPAARARTVAVSLF